MPTRGMESRVKVPQSLAFGPELELESLLSLYCVSKKFSSYCCDYVLCGDCEVMCSCVHKKG